MKLIGRSYPAKQITNREKCLNQQNNLRLFLISDIELHDDKKEQNEAVENIFF